MNLALSQDQSAVRDLAEGFAKELRGSMRDTEKAGTGAFKDTYADLGFAALDWPSSAEGHDLGRWAKVLTLEALAFGDAAATLGLEQTAWVCSPLLEVPDMAKAIVERLGEPTWQPVLYLDLDERITLESGALSGEIPYVPADRCDALFLMCGDTLHCLEGELAACSVRPSALHAAGGVAITLTGHRPARSWSLSPAVAGRIRGIWRLSVAALLVGLADAAARQTRAYCLERVTFGKKVAHHQAAAFMLADMEIAVEAARSLVWSAAQRIDAGGPADPCHSAFIEAAECALSVSNNSVQLHGGHGYVEDYPVEKWMREARALTLLVGGVDGARADVHRTLEQRWIEGAQ